MVAPDGSHTALGWALAERVLAMESPLPESSVRALARLRREAGWGRDE